MSETKDNTPYTATTLAQAAGISKGYVSRLCRLGKLECVKAGGVWIISPEVGRAFLEGREPET